MASASSSSPKATVNPHTFHPFPEHCMTIDAAFKGDIGKLKDRIKEIGDERKFRRMCDSIDCLGYTILHAAVRSGNFNICTFLVEEVGVEVDVKSHTGATPLQLAIRAGNDLAAVFLMDNGAKVTMADANGLTALHLAIVHGRKMFMSMLLKHGADIDADSVIGTPLHLASKHGSVDIVKFLLENNAEPNSVSKSLSSCTPLISAIYSKTNAAETVELLLKAKADPNMFVNGLSPLAHALENKSNSCIEALLAAGADVDLVSWSGLRPIEHAAFANDLQAFWMLLRARPRILATPNLRLAKLINSIRSVEAQERKNLYIRHLKQNGDDAWDEKDYSSAVASYSEAMHHNPSDEKVVANRSLCWACMGEGVCALHDAKICVGWKPGWALAHFREASAWHLLKYSRMSSDRFKKAFELDPANEQIDR